MVRISVLCPNEPGKRWTRLPYYAGNTTSTRLNLCRQPAWCDISPIPPFWEHSVGTVQCRDGRATVQPERTLQISSQDLNRARHSGFAGCGEAIGISSSTQTARAPRQIAFTMSVPTNTPFIKISTVTFHGRDHFRQGCKDAGTQSSWRPP